MMFRVTCLLISEVYDFPVFCSLACVAHELRVLPLQCWSCFFYSNTLASGSQGLVNFALFLLSVGRHGANREHVEKENSNR